MSIEYLSVDDVLEYHKMVIAHSGGADGILNRGSVESAVAQPQAAFGGVEFYPTLAEKAAALGFSLIKNHAFQDGNKRIGNVAMKAFLALNGLKIDCPVDEQERVILDVAAGLMAREVFTEWLRTHVRERRADEMQF